jgi:branched-chain amino acid transport system ATP-binding protein
MSRGDKRRFRSCHGSLIQNLAYCWTNPLPAWRDDTNATIDFKQLTSNGMTKVIIEHDMHVVFSLATRGVLAQGRIIATGSEIMATRKSKRAYLGGSRDR